MPKISSNNTNNFVIQVKRVVAVKITLCATVEVAYENHIIYNVNATAYILESFSFLDNNKV